MSPLATPGTLPKLSVAFTDWRGHEIRVGSIVLYPSEWGSGCRMVEGVVGKIVVRTNRNGEPEYKVQVLPKRHSRAQRPFATWYGSSYVPVTISHWQNLTAVI